MSEIEKIKSKSVEDTTIAEAIVLFFAGDDEEKQEALSRIDFLQKKNSKVAEAIVSFLAGDEKEKKEALDCIAPLSKEESSDVKTKSTHSSMHLSLVKE